MRQLATKVDIATNGTMTGGLTGTLTQKVTDAYYIANKLSVMTLNSAAYAGISAKSYTVPLTGGSFTISNNLTYLTPANIGVVNRPVTYFTGTRSVTATVNAYLKTGTNTSATLLSDLLTSSLTYTDNRFAAVIKLGGVGSTRVEIDMPTTALTIPAINSEQIISTSINMTAQGYNSGTSTYDLEQNNEASIRYYCNNSAG